MDEEVDLECPTCGEVTGHRVLRAAPASWTVACESCGKARAVPAPRSPKPVRIPVVLAEGATSRRTEVEVDRLEEVAAGDELELEGHRVQVTGIEGAGGRLAGRTPAGDIRVLHAKVFDKVTLHLQLNEGETTRSFQVELGPDRVVEVGEVFEVQGLRLRVATLTSAEHRTLRRGALPARGILKAKVRRLTLRNREVR
jgi:uncharacterized Zn finger protein